LDSWHGPTVSLSSTGPCGESPLTLLADNRPGAGQEISLRGAICARDGVDQAPDLIAHLQPDIVVERVVDT
jgi:hypothetical protein